MTAKAPIHLRAAGDAAMAGSGGSMTPDQLAGLQSIGLLAETSRKVSRLRSWLAAQLALRRAFEGPSDV